MKLEVTIKSIPFKEILNEFVSLYLKEYGEVQLKEISQKIHSSKTVDKFLQETNIAKAKPFRDDFLGVIHSIFYFTFAKAEKIAFGAIALLCKWQKEVAKPNNLEDNQHLNETFFDILEKCKGFKIQNSNVDNFFTKFEHIVEDKFSDASIVANEIQNKPNNSEFMLELVLRRVYDDSIKFFHESMCISFDDVDYLEEEEVSKLNKETFEIVIIVFAIMSLAISRDENVKNKYEDSFNKFVSIKLEELSKGENYSGIFYTKEFYLFMEMMDRVDFYKKEIKKLVDNKIYTPPFGIYYYFFLNPGNYSPYAEYTGLEESEIQFSIKDGDFSLEIEMMTSIKEIYRIILNQLV